jgi:hypothetical protein
MLTLDTVYGGTIMHRTQRRRIAMSQQLALVLAATLTVWAMVARGAPAHAADLTVPAEAPVEHVAFTPPNVWNGSAPKAFQSS